MSKLSRAIQKIFGDSGGTGEFGQIGSKAAGAAATTKDLTTMQALTEYLQGMNAIVSDQGTSVLPYLEDFNALHFLETSQIAYLFQSGISEWLNSADQRYYQNESLVMVPGDGIYFAILGDDGANINAQKDPQTETLWWRRIVDFGGEVYPVGSTYIQFPGDSDPSTIGFPGTWSNVSSELAGDFIRFEGGDASAFESGQQLDQFQGHWHNTTATLDYVSGASKLAVGPHSNGPISYDTLVKGPVTDTVNGSPRTGTETRPVNRTARKWRRTA